MYELQGTGLLACSQLKVFWRLQRQVHSRMRRDLAVEADVLEECPVAPKIVTPMHSHSSGAEASAISDFYSARIEGLRNLESKFANLLEIDVESSKSHCRRGLAEEGDLLRGVCIFQCRDPEHHHINAIILFVHWSLGR